MTTHWLRNGTETSISFAAFTCVGNDTVKVMALVGATQYIDREMPKQEARDTWKKFLDEGWHRATDDELKSQKMDTRVLKMFIYD